MDFTPAWHWTDVKIAPVSIWIRIKIKIARSQSRSTTSTTPTTSTMSKLSRSQFGSRTSTSSSLSSVNCQSLLISIKNLKIILIVTNDLTSKWHQNGLDLDLDPHWSALLILLNSDSHLFVLTWFFTLVKSQLSSLVVDINRLCRSSFGAFPAWISWINWPIWFYRISSNRSCS